MLIRESLIDEVKALSELELQELINEIVAHLKRQKLGHLLDLDPDGNKEKVEELEDEIQELKDAMREARYLLDI